MMMHFRTSASLLLRIACLAVAVAGCSAQPRSHSPAFFIPPDAQSIKHAAAPGQTAVEYVVQDPYPASQFACRVMKHLEALGWRALREDALNPGNPTGVVVGWGEIIDNTRDPERRVHMLLTEWLNEQNDLLVYGFTYEYPVGSAPDLSTLTVRASLMPEDVVRAHLGARTDHLRSLLVASRRDPGGSRDVPPDNCSSPQWSDFVAKTV